MSDFWKGRNVFITGALGMIGAHVAMQLKDRGAELTILKRDHQKDSLIEKNRLIDDVNVVRGELEEFDSVERALAEYEIDTVFHLAAQPIVRISKIIPKKTFESNIMGTWNVLEAARLVNAERQQVKRIVVASSDKAYGTSKKLPYTEDMPLKGDLPYDVSKSCCDLIAQSYYKTYKLPLAISRLGNVFGPGDLNFSRIIPGTIKSILLDEEIVIRTDGRPVREYLYVKDAADAYITLAEKLESKKLFGEAFNFSSGNRMAVLEVAEKILKAMGSGKKPRVLGEVKDEIPEQYLSTEKAEKLLGWKAKTDFNSALKETIGWYKDFFGGN